MRIANRYPLTVFGDEIEIDSPLAGAHQQRNLALAIAAAVELRNNHGYDIKSANVEAGVRKTIWPARLERIAGNGKRAAILLDVGHNPAGAWALRAAVSRLDDGQPLTLVFSCLKDKPVQELAQILFPLFGHVVVAPVDSPRATPVEELLAAAKATGSTFEAAPDPAAALERALALTPPDGLVVVTGSIYLVGKIRARIGWRKNDCERGGVARMTATRQTPLPLPVRLRSNILRAPWFFLSTGFFGSLSLLASCFESDGRLQHRIARIWARVSLMIAGRSGHRDRQGAFTAGRDLRGQPFVLHGHSRDFLAACLSPSASSPRRAFGSGLSLAGI